AEAEEYRARYDAERAVWDSIFTNGITYTMQIPDQITAIILIREFKTRFTDSIRDGSWNLSKMQEIFSAMCYLQRAYLTLNTSPLLLPPPGFLKVSAKYTG